MIKLSFCFLLVNLMVATLSAQTNIERIKPVLKLEVSIDGKQFSINDGDTLHFENKTIVIKTSDYFTFNFGALRFDYPKLFSFQFEQDTAYKCWTLDGSNFVITYFEFGVPVELDEFIKDMVKKFGKKNCTVSNKYMKLGEIELFGKRIFVTMIGQKLTYDMYKINTKDNNTHFIAFQDSKNDDGSDSVESLETMEIINKTIKKK